MNTATKLAERRALRHKARRIRRKNFRAKEMQQLRVSRGKK